MAKRVFYGGILVLFCDFYVIKSNGELFELGMGCQTRTKDWDFVFVFVLCNLEGKSNQG